MTVIMHFFFNVLMAVYLLQLSIVLCAPQPLEVLNGVRNSTLRVNEEWHLNLTLRSSLDEHHPLFIHNSDDAVFLVPANRVVEYALNGSAQMTYASGIVAPVTDAISGDVHMMCSTPDMGSGVLYAMAMDKHATTLFGILVVDRGEAPELLAWDTKDSCNNDTEDDAEMKLIARMQLMEKPSEFGFQDFQMAMSEDDTLLYVTVGDQMLAANVSRLVTRAASMGDTVPLSPVVLLSPDMKQVFCLAPLPEEGYIVVVGGLEGVIWSVDFHDLQAPVSNDRTTMDKQRSLRDCVCQSTFSADDASSVLLLTVALSHESGGVDGRVLLMEVDADGTFHTPLGGIELAHRDPYNVAMNNKNGLLYILDEAGVTSMNVQNPSVPVVLSQTEFRVYGSDTRVRLGVFDDQFGIVYDHGELHVLDLRDASQGAKLQKGVFQLPTSGVNGGNEVHIRHNGEFVFFFSVQGISVASLYVSDVAVLKSVFTRVDTGDNILMLTASEQKSKTSIMTPVRVKVCPCPANAHNLGERSVACSCNDGFVGTVTWNAALASYSGSCTCTGALGSDGSCCAGDSCVLGACQDGQCSRLVLYVAAGSVAFLVALAFVIKKTSAMKKRQEELVEPLLVKATELEQMQQRLLVPSSDVVLSQVLGAGAFGQVYSLVFESTQYAVKKLHSILTSEEQLAAMLQEADMLQRLHNPRILRFRGFLVDSPVEADNDVEQQGGRFGGKIISGIVTEFCKHGSLTQFLLQHPSLNWARRGRIALDVVQGLVYLHAKGIVHRDLKPDNVLVDENGRCRLADFGTSTLLSYLDVHEGTINYQAPECLMATSGGRVHVNQALDVYSFGMTLYFIATGTEPWIEEAFNNNSDEKQDDTQTAKAPSDIVRDLVLSGRRPSLYNNDGKKKEIPLVWVTLYEWCCQQDAKERPNASDIEQFLLDNQDQGKFEVFSQSFQTKHV